MDDKKIDNNTNEESTDRPEQIKKLWYALNISNVNQRQIINLLQNRIKESGLGDQIGEILLVEKKQKHLKTNKITYKNIYAGYIFINMTMNNDTWKLVKNTPGVFGFVGSVGNKSQPLPISDEEAEEVKKTLEENKDYSPTYFINFKVGDVIKINDKNLPINQGKVLSIDDKKGIAIVEIEMFGRLISWKIKLNKIEKF
ncbi:transcription termination/antitermination protein NusG [Mycoplasma sp. SG1]|uniref:transcription termination/antitermination protein NusG n=1 Tax=Mycoplasma sp. SG1 TaxID=2810348 RepID=UPI002025A57C|nr:transcription termination/antitermination protein NusG [Mycoplasma sp. SG1]URM52878.1 hypothetical protein JRW51_00840 [Mycoplasma sp. SG1]